MALKIVDDIKSENIEWKSSKTDKEPGEWIEVEGGALRLSDIQLKKIEMDLWEYIRETSDVEFRRRDLYTYQYKFLNKNEALIQGLCAYKTLKDLTKEFYKVTDGGSCYFNVKFDISLSKFYDLYIHGGA